MGVCPIPKNKNLNRIFLDVSFAYISLMILRNGVMSICRVVYGIHTVIDHYVMYIVVGEKYLDICTRFKVVSSKT